MLHKNMLVLTNYMKQGQGKFPLLGTLPYNSTQSIPYERQLANFTSALR